MLVALKILQCIFSRACTFSTILFTFLLAVVFLKYQNARNKAAVSGSKINLLMIIIYSNVSFEAMKTMFGG